MRDQKRHKYRASTKSGTWNIPEHPGTWKNENNFHEKILIIIIIITIIIIIFVKINKYRKITKKRKRKKEGKRNSNHLRV